MKVLFMISHPAHFWMFKYTIDNLKRDGHKVVIVIRPKDVLEQLCINAGMDFYKVKNRPKKWGMFGLAIFLIEKIFEVLHIARKEKPDIHLAVRSTCYTAVGCSSAAFIEGVFPDFGVPSASLQPNHMY